MGKYSPVNLRERSGNLIMSDNEFNMEGEEIKYSLIHSIGECKTYLASINIGGESFTVESDLLCQTIQEIQSTSFLRMAKEIVNSLETD